MRVNLPEDFVAPWDQWCREMMAASREELGDEWDAAWMEAPVWNYLMPPGRCGAQAVLGVWLPSVDKVGRRFPLTLCALAESGLDLEDGALWLQRAQEAGVAGIVEDVAHEDVMERLLAACEDMKTPENGAPLWWTEGSPLVKPQQLSFDGFPPLSLAGTLLRDPTLTEPI